MNVYDVAPALPDITALRDRCRALAMLDAILSPEWESRYYSFDSRWAPGTELAPMRNGSGDEYSVVFAAAGVFVRGFAHESSMSPAANGGEPWPGLVAGIPPALASWVDEPAFGYEGVFEATVCLWREAGDDRWRMGDVDLPAGPDPDGAGELFAVLLDETPGAYRSFAEDYYEVPVDGDAAAEVFALRPLTVHTVHRLNPGLTLADLAADRAGIGYP